MRVEIRSRDDKGRSYHDVLVNGFVEDTYPEMEEAEALAEAFRKGEEEPTVSAPLRDTFASPFQQYSHRIGHPFVFTGIVKTGETHPAEMDVEVGPLYRIRFPDGEEIDAWPEEVLIG